MSRGVRFYKSKRWCHECQTEIELDIQDSEDIKLIPMGFDILSALRFVIPPEKAHTVKAGNLYVRCHSGGKEFVRKRPHVNKCKDTMCKKCSHGHDGRHAQESILAHRYAALAERRRYLEAEQVKAEDREIQRRIGIRDRRPYHFTTERRDTTPPPNTAAEMAPGHCRRRKVSFAEDESSPSHHHGCRCQKHQQHHRPSHHYSDNDRSYTYYTPHQDAYVREIEPPSSYRHHERRPSRIISNNVYHNGTPIFCSRIITGGRRKSSSDSCRRAPGSYSHHYPDVEYETREPEDYYC